MTVRLCRRGSHRNPAPDLATRIDLLWSVPRSPGKPGTAVRELFPSSGMTLVMRLSASGSRVVLLGPAAEKDAFRARPLAGAPETRVVHRYRG